MNQTVSYILTLPIFRTKVSGDDDEQDGYFNYCGKKRYISVLEFKQALNTIVEGRHEVYFTKTVIKGCLVDTSRNKNMKMFYDCDFNTGIFCMWMDLNDKDIKSWLRHGNKLRNSKWLNNPYSNSNSNLTITQVSRPYVQLVHLVLFQHNKYYIYQQDDVAQYNFDYYDDHIKVVIATYNKITRYQQHGNVIRLCMSTINKLLLGNGHIDIVTFINNNKVSTKTITKQSRINDNFNCHEYCIHDDRMHGMSRLWRNLNSKQVCALTKYNFIPMNLFHNNLAEIGCYHDGYKHGLFFEYNPYDTNVLHYSYNSVLCSVKRTIDKNITYTTQCNNNYDYYWSTFSNYNLVLNSLFHHNSVINNAHITMYLGLYLLCRDGYIICHDDKVNRFLTFFDRLPPELAELLLYILTGHNQIRINRSFTLAGIDLLYPITAHY